MICVGGSTGSSSFEYFNTTAQTLLFRLSKHLHTQAFSLLRLLSSLCYPTSLIMFNPSKELEPFLFLRVIHPCAPDMMSFLVVGCSSIHGEIDYQCKGSSEAISLPPISCTSAQLRLRGKYYPTFLSCQRTQLVVWVKFFYL